MTNTTVRAQRKPARPVARMSAASTALMPMSPRVDDSPAVDMLPVPKPTVIPWKLIGLGAAALLALYLVRR